MDDYYAADLFRSHGNRGSTYLFLRWCADRYGIGPAHRAWFTRDLKGTANLEAATGSTFADLYRRWSLALFSSGLDRRARAPPAMTTASGRSICGRLARNGSWPGRDSTRVAPDGSVERLGGAGDQQSFPGRRKFAVGRGRDRGRGPARGRNPGDRRAAGCRLAPARPRREQGPRPGRGTSSPGSDQRAQRSVRPALGSLMGAARRRSRTPIRPIFGADGSICWASPRPSERRPCPAAGELRSRLIPLPGVSPSIGPLAVKVVGTDEKGRRIAAWAEVDADLPPRRPEPPISRSTRVDPRHIRGAIQDERVAADSQALHGVSCRGCS